MQLYFIIALEGDGILLYKRLLVVDQKLNSNGGFSRKKLGGSWNHCGHHNLVSRVLKRLVANGSRCGKSTQWNRLGSAERIVNFLVMALILLHLKRKPSMLP